MELVYRNNAVMQNKNITAIEITNLGVLFKVTKQAFPRYFFPLIANGRRKEEIRVEKKKQRKCAQMPRIEKKRKQPRKCQCQKLLTGHKEVGLTFLSETHLIFTNYQQSW